MNETEGTGNGQVMTGWDRVAAERQRQIDVEGYDPSRDWFQYTKRELQAAASAYMQAAAYLEEFVAFVNGAHPSVWPWPAEAFKVEGGPVRCSEKAGALFLAQADVDRQNKDEARAAVMMDGARVMAENIDRLLVGRPRCVNRWMGDLIREFADAVQEHQRDGELAEAAVLQVVTMRLKEALKNWSWDWDRYNAKVQAAMQAAVQVEGKQG